MAMARPTLTRSKAIATATASRITSIRRGEGSRAALAAALSWPLLEVALRQASLLVHHGGIGTTARALQAGVPQIISPLAYDQPDNGERVVELGVGKVLERPQLTGENLAGLCRRLWDDPNVRAQLARRARSMEENDALARAADAILRFTQGERHAHT